MCGKTPPVVLEMWILVVEALLGGGITSEECGGEGGGLSVATIGSWVPHNYYDYIYYSTILLL
jgi:hypothetical protein